MKTEIINIYKHPYKWGATVTLGTKEEMIANAKRTGYYHGQRPIAGSFNEQMNNTRRAALIQIAFDEENNIVQQCPWEGTYHYCHLFDQYIIQGLYPIKINWDGKTYIQRWNKLKEEYIYVLTDTYRY